MSLKVHDFVNIMVIIIRNQILQKAIFSVEKMSVKWLTRSSGPSSFRFSGIVNDQGCY